MRFSVLIGTVSLIVTRIPFPIENNLVRERRQFEDASCRALTTVELFSMFNDTIHDQEIIELNRKRPIGPTKKKKKREKEPVKPTRATLVTTREGNPRDPKGKAAFKTDTKRIEKLCLLCGQMDHYIRQHHFDVHKPMDVDEVKQKCRENGLCFKCALPLNKTDHRNASECANITQACFYSMISWS